MAAKRLKLRRADVCVDCGTELAVGVEAWRDSNTCTVTCITCQTDLADAPADDTAAPAVDGGQPGGSLGREHRRRRANRERRVREAHPHVGGLLLAWNDEPLVPTGIYVIDAKAVTGKVEVRTRWFKPPLLYIDGRDGTRHLDGLDRQTQAVREALAAAGHPAAPVHGALCFTKADLPYLRSLEMRGQLLTYRRQLRKRLTARGLLTQDACAALASAFTTGLRAA